MKTKKLYDILMFLPLLITLTALPFLPDQIPAHYGFDNRVTRWGSKYEALLYPVTTVFLGYFLLAMAKLAARQEEHGKNNEKVAVVTGLSVLVLFNALNFYALYTDFNRIEDLSSVSLNISQLLFGLFGAAMIVTGNLMPRLRMNSIIGLKTKWSMKNETVWKKSQRFGGISFMIGGIAIIAVCFLTEGVLCLLWALGILTGISVVDVFYTYQSAGKF